MDSFIKDIRFGLRSLLKRPGFTVIAVLTLALGIGANAAIFSMVNATLMRPLPVAHPSSLVFVFNGPSGSVFSYPDYATLRDQNTVLDGLIAWGGITASLNSDDQTDLVTGAIVSGNFFDVLGVRAQLGRVISTEDDKTPGAHPVAVISPRLWQTRFGGDPNIVGRQLLLRPEGPWREIIGVVRTSKYISLGETPTPVAYVPLSQNHETGMTLHVRTAVDPLSVAGAVRSEVQSLERNLPLGTPERMSDRVANSLYAARMGAILLAVFGGLALLLASIGLYGVMSFAVSRRTREMGIRVALGARPGDVFRLVLRQGMTLVVAGLILGLGVAVVVTRLLASFLTA